VLVECEGDALDLSGDMGAVGRFSVNSTKVSGEDELSLDLKGNGLILILLSFIHHWGKLQAIAKIFALKYM
jgi:hypothetical protein